MIKTMLQSLYYKIKWLLIPFNMLWRWLYAVPIDVSNNKKILIVDVIGGSGKTTLSNTMLRIFGWHQGSVPKYHQIYLDECKYGDNWKRYTNEEFEEKITAELEYAKKYRNNQYIIDGTYHDPKLTNQSLQVDKIMNNADLVIWNDLPKLLVLWRKLFRSFKMAINVCDQGVAPERWNNVKEMGKKTWREFDERWNILNNKWIENAHDMKYKRIHWPYYYEIVDTTENRNLN